MKSPSHWIFPDSGRGVPYGLGSSKLTVVALAAAEGRAGLPRRCPLTARTASRAAWVEYWAHLWHRSESTPQVPKGGQGDRVVLAGFISFTGFEVSQVIPSTTQ